MNEKDLWKTIIITVSLLGSSLILLYIIGGWLNVLAGAIVFVISILATLLTNRVIYGK